MCFLGIPQQAEDFPKGPFVGAMLYRFGQPANLPYIDARKGLFYFFQGCGAAVKIAEPVAQGFQAMEIRRVAAVALIEFGDKGFRCFLRRRSSIVL